MIEPSTMRQLVTGNKADALSQRLINLIWDPGPGTRHEREGWSVRRGHQIRTYHQVGRIVGVGLYQVNTKKHKNHYIYI
jgi:hypothetical protein